MKFTVNWLPPAEQELAGIWLNASDRNTITRTAHAIDVQLQNDPDSAGESRPKGRRILFAPPLGVLFKIRSDQQLVEVLHVWQFSKKKK